MIWRRRIVALIVLLALVAGLVWGVGALVRTLTAQGAEDGTSSAQGSAGAGSEDDAGPASSAGAAEEEPAGPVDPGKCSPRDLDVRLSATPGQPTSFAVTLTNRAEVACLLDAGAASLVVTVHSGEDRVWSSGDCVVEPAARELLLDSGDSTETAIRWDGTRSAKGCPGGQGAAQPGSYRVAATLGGASLPAADTSFTL
ncbi:hypothetical protein KZX45_04355 [Georgenia sp. EYE_87]|uniref:hypothetical protein n=1 Tax=Georgenia sp. EYE_87 TaxID=2853448 RepID=UPI002006AF35|nr:hypothetical protein [Georgenia sp. EYE_87]MCK6209771.1 hypothetical protein [Georgenia sp. EYE_87]